MPENDPAPEFYVQAAYLQVFRRLRRQIAALAFAVLFAAGVGGGAIWTAHEERAQGHRDTQAQIRALVCFVVDLVPPDGGAADQLRAQYKCGPYIHRA